MMTPETQSLVIRESKGWVTNIDERDLSEDYFLRVRNLRVSTGAKIAERDYGTIERFLSALYPTVNLDPSTITFLDGCTMTDPTDKAQYDFLAGLDKNGKLHVWAFDGASFVELTRTFTAIIQDVNNNGSGFPVQAVITLTAIQENSLSTTLPVGADPDNCKDYVIVNTNGGLNKAALVFDNTANQVTLLSVDISASGMNWQAGQSVVLYRSCGLFNASFNPDNGLTPHIRWLLNDSQRKARFMYASSTTPPATRTPILFMRRPQRSYFYTGTTPQLSIPAASQTRWYAEEGGGLIPYCASFGSRDIFKIGTGVYSTLTATTPDTTNYPLNSWLRIDIQNTTGDGLTVPFKTYSFVYITVGYDDYQESDPVLKFFCGGSDTGGVQTIRIQAFINPATMPKNVTQLKIYRYTVDLDSAIGDAAIQQFLKAIGDDQVQLAKTINLQSSSGVGDVSFAFGPTSIDEPYGRFLYAQYDSLADVLETSDSITGNLGHQIVTNRSIIPSRYAARATKDQGAVIVTDQNDSTLRISSYDGAGAHEDDNFPNISADNTGGKQVIFLTSFGELLGVAINNDMAVALKRNSIELCDFQASQRQQVIQADVLAKRSIIQTPWGLIWAGNSAIYIMPSDGGRVEVLNMQWKNFYDGTLLTSNPTPVPFMTQMQKMGIIAGYEPTYHAVWFVMTVNTEDGLSTEQLIARYYFGEKQNKWDIRTIDGTSVAWLSQTESAITIGHPSGMLSYPNMSGGSNFKDNVLADGSGGTGIPVSYLLNIGSLYHLTKQNVFCGIKLDHWSKGTGKFRLRFFLNDLVTYFEEKFFDVTEHPHDRPLPPMGSVKRLRIEGALVGADADTIGQHDINTIELQYISRVAGG